MENFNRENTLCSEKPKYKTMSLTSQLPKLSAEQLKSLCDTMLNAAIAHENGGNAREVFRRAKQGKVGLLRRIYELLEKSNREEIETLSKSLAEINP